MRAAEILVSVAIPARDPRERLARTLESIAAAEFDARRLEVVVADDGSTDGAVDRLAARAWPFRLVHRRGRWGSQSAATNEAIRHARGRWLLLSAQDILFHRDLIARHLHWHERFADEEIAVLGDLPYAPHLEVTPFMFYLVRGGFQFAYYMIHDPLRVPPNFVYAPNLSLSRRTLERVGPFDERFPYGCQDTDLGIRLHRAGVRIVYDRRAIGYHDHPVTLEEYFRRQEVVAAGVVRLRDKHPDDEGDLTSWNVVVRAGLAYSDVRREIDLAEIAAIERELAGGPDFRPLWERAFCRQESLDGFDGAERELTRRVDRLFNAYNRVLQFHFARGFLAESLRVHGAARVEAIVRARLAKLQASAQTWRVVERRLAEWSLPVALCSPGDFLGAKIVHGIDDYAAARACLEPYQFPRAAAFAQQLLLVLERGRFSDAELERVEQTAEVVLCRERGAGILEALGRARGETVIVAAAGAAVADDRARALATAMFERLPGVAVLGGWVVEPDTGAARHGWRLASSGSGAEALRRAATVDGAAVPVDAAIGEFLVVRRAGLDAVLGELAHRPLDERSWNLELCRAWAARGGATLHVPAFGAGKADAATAGARA